MRLKHQVPLVVEIQTAYSRDQTDDLAVYYQLELKHQQLRVPSYVLWICAESVPLPVGEAPVERLLRDGRTNDEKHLVFSDKCQPVPEQRVSLVAPRRPQRS